MVIGILVAVIGLALLVGGAIGGAIEQTRSNADPEAEGRTPGSLTFLADNDTYRVSVEDELAGSDPSLISANVACTVTLADASTVELGGAMQMFSETTGNIASVGSFEAIEGETTISCTASDNDVRFFVDAETALQRLGTAALIAGFVVGSIGAVLILLGVFTRKKPRAATSG